MAANEEVVMGTGWAPADPVAPLESPVPPPHPSAEASRASESFRLRSLINDDDDDKETDSNFEEGAKALSVRGDEDARDVPSKADPDPTADARLSIDASCPSDGIPGEVMGADPHSPLFLGRAGDMAVAD